MVKIVQSATILGLHAYSVEIEVCPARGLPGFTMVGLPDTAAQEARDRVRSAIISSGFKFPREKITVNLAPANIKKEGPRFDLAIAVGILLASDQCTERKDLRSLLFLGELALDGRLRPIQGAFSIALSCVERGFSGRFMIPQGNGAEIGTVPGVLASDFTNLREVVETMGEDALPERVCLTENEAPPVQIHLPDMSDVRGHEIVKRAMEVAASGFHNLLMAGPPGSGKSMLAQRFPSILPEMSEPEKLEVTRIYSIMGLHEGEKGLVQSRPFRSPHHTCSDVSLVGGGRKATPGEVSLAHQGVLFLDEVLEFRRSVLEVLRQPLSDGKIHVSRAENHAVYPARFLLVAALNPCPCGFLGDSRKPCTCSELIIERYLSKLSGPMLDRIDIQLQVPRLEVREWNRPRPEPSKSIQLRVEAARSIQRKRFEQYPFSSNGIMDQRATEKFCPLSQKARRELELVIEKEALSNRAYSSILKTSRTIADLAEAEVIEYDHICEAVFYRSLKLNP
ncbi:YifB family Mg chelatase-like AAA ATPase [bacterium]|jgi:magnesium chelatase family protein|nr:YifB family Mg chelatase-like AAA ATPase [bacterium]